MKKLILIAIACFAISSAVAQGSGWQKVYNNNYNQQFNQVLTINDNGYTGTVIVNFPLGAQNISWERDGNQYYATCSWNNGKYRKPLHNISWQQQRNYNQQFNSNWNCQVTAPIGYNYNGYSTIGNDYYANYWYAGNYYRQQIGIGVASFILNSAAGIINTIQFNNNWNNGFNGWNNNGCNNRIW